MLSIALTSWVQYARTVRALTMVERRKEYVLAARIIKAYDAWDLREEKAKQARLPFDGEGR